jgi:CBS domain-containing protein
MSVPVQVINGLDSVQHAIEFMQENRVSSLVIERRHEHDEYGVVSVRDIAREVIARNRAPERVSVYEIMLKPVLTLEAGMDIKYALRLLSRFHLTRALVTDEGRMVGIVTLRDMVLNPVVSPSSDKGATEE